MTARQARERIADNLFYAVLSEDGAQVVGCPPFEAPEVYREKALAVIDEAGRDGLLAASELGEWRAVLADPRRLREVSDRYRS